MKQLNCQERHVCRAHQEKTLGKCFSESEILPDGICPVLYHSLYPYFMALHFNAKLDYTAGGADLIHCPASEEGVQCLVWREPNAETKWQVKARVVHSQKCPNNHYVSQEFVFPDTRKDSYLCPAGWFNAFPFLPLPDYVKQCCKPEKLRCPDWNGHIYFDTRKQK